MIRFPTFPNAVCRIYILQAQALPRLQKLPMMSEKKRKLFLYQEELNCKLDWEKMKKRKVSKFHPICPTLTDDALDGPKEIYQKTRTVTDGTSNDIFMVTVPAPSANALENRNAQVVARILKGFQPKHQAVKIGNIERQGRSRQLRRISCFSLNLSDSVIFTSEQKLQIPNAPMQFLSGGHTSVNKWPVPELLEQQMPKITLKKYDDLFPAEKDATPMESDDEAALPVDDTTSQVRS